MGRKKNNTDSSPFDRNDKDVAEFSKKNHEDLLTEKTVENSEESVNCIFCDKSNISKFDYVDHILLDCNKERTYSDIMRSLSWISGKLNVPESSWGCPFCFNVSLKSYSDLMDMHLTKRNHRSKQCRKVYHDIESRGIQSVTIYHFEVVSFATRQKRLPYSKLKFPSVKSLTNEIREKNAVSVRKGDRSHEGVAESISPVVASLQTLLINTSDDLKNSFTLARKNKDVAHLCLMFGLLYQFFQNLDKEGQTLSTAEMKAVLYSTGDKPDWIHKSIKPVGDTYVNPGPKPDTNTNCVLVTAMHQPICFIFDNFGKYLNNADLKRFRVYKRKLGRLVLEIKSALCNPNICDISSGILPDSVKYDAIDGYISMKLNRIGESCESLIELMEESKYTWGDSTMNHMLEFTGILESIEVVPFSINQRQYIRERIAFYAMKVLDILEGKNSGALDFISNRLLLPWTSPKHQSNLGQFEFNFHKIFLMVDEVKASKPLELLMVDIPPDMIDNLQRDMIILYETLKPSPRSITMKYELCSKLAALFRGQVLIYGSIAAGFSFEGSDIDLCLIAPDFEDASKMVRKLKSKLLRAGEYTEVTAIPWARIPIVKLVHTLSRLEADVCINNCLAVENSRLLRTYAEYDPRVKHLVIMVKYWSKQNCISAASEGTLSSYSWVNLVVFFLQTTSPPVVPVLQRDVSTLTDDDGRVYTGEYDIRFHNYIELPEKNHKCVAELFIDFLKYYAVDFCFKSSVVSIRTGDALLKSKVWDRSKSWRFSIEDPFERSDHDLGSVLSRDGQSKIFKCFQETIMLLQSGKGLSDIMQKLTADSTPGDKKVKRRFGRGGKSRKERFNRKKAGKPKKNVA